MKKIVLFLGVPGSGKGTQAEILRDQLGYTHISTGELLRQIAEDPNASPEDKKEIEQMRAGGLVSDEMVVRVTFGAVKKALDAGEGVVLDGVVRSLEQARRFDAFFDEIEKKDELVVIEIALSDDEILARMQSRIESGNARPDDTPEVMKERIEKQGNKALKPITDFYKEKDLLVQIDGSQSIERVTEEIRTTIA